MFCKAVAVMGFGSVVGTFQHGMITRNAQKVIDSLKPGGIVILKGFHRDINEKNTRGGGLRYGTNELLRAFERLRLLRYEDTKGEAACGKADSSPQSYDYWSWRKALAGNQR